MLAPNTGSVRMRVPWKLISQRGVAEPGDRDAVVAPLGRRASAATCPANPSRSPTIRRCWNQPPYFLAGFRWRVILSLSRISHRERATHGATRNAWGAHPIASPRRLPHVRLMNPIKHLAIALMAVLMIGLMVFYFISLLLARLSWRSCSLASFSSRSSVAADPKDSPRSRVAQISGACQRRHRPCQPRPHVYPEQPPCGPAGGTAEAR